VDLVDLLDFAFSWLFTRSLHHRDELAGFGPHSIGFSLASESFFQNLN
jgi:hypothetical protein